MNEYSIYGIRHSCSCGASTTELVRPRVSPTQAAGQRCSGPGFGEDDPPGTLRSWLYPGLGKAPRDAPLAYPGRAVSGTVQDKLPRYCSGRRRARLPAGSTAPRAARNRRCAEKKSLLAGQGEMPGCVRVTACLLGASNSQGSTKSFWFRRRRHHSVTAPPVPSPGAARREDEEGRPGEEQHGKFGDSLRGARAQPGACLQAQSSAGSPRLSLPSPLFAMHSRSLCPGNTEVHPALLSHCPANLFPLTASPVSGSPPPPISSLPSSILTRSSSRRDLLISHVLMLSQPCLCQRQATLGPGICSDGPELTHCGHISVPAQPARQLLWDAAPAPTAE